MTAASPIAAADVSPASVSASTTFVVRADPRTGKLVRRPAPHPQKQTTAPKPPPSVKPEISAMVEQAAKTHAVDPLLVGAVIAVESNYDAHAVSPKGAEGLMQLMPPTARMLGVTNTFDPQQNIEAGVRYLKQLQDQYKDDTLALAAYNAGPKAVEKFKTVPPYRETQNYVDQVGRRYDAARAAAPKSAEPAAVPPAVAPAQQISGEDQHRKLQQSLDENGRLSLKTSP
jgi:hypothetical protein